MDYEDLWKSAYDTRKTRWKERQIVLGTTAKPGDAVTSIKSKKKIGPSTENAEQAPRIVLNADETGEQSSNHI